MPIEVFLKGETNIELLIILLVCQVMYQACIKLSIQYVIPHAHRSVFVGDNNIYC
jgi:hypothetical protein